MIKYEKTMPKLLTLALLFFLCNFFFSPTDLSAKKKKTLKKKRVHRVYNPEKTRNEALEVLNSSSASYLVKLANGEIEDEYLLLDSLILDAGEDPIELELEDDKPVDLDVFRTMYLSYIEGEDESIVGTTLAGISKKKIMEAIINWLGTPYYFGGTTDRGIDCSAFTRQIFYLSAHLLLPRTAAEQYKIGKKVDKNNLEFGDLVFFHTRRHAYVSHVGIYIGDGLFAHSSSRYGVTVSSLESQYYSKRFIGARRITQKDFAKLLHKDNLSE